MAEKHYVIEHTLVTGAAGAGAAHPQGTVLPAASLGDEARIRSLLQRGAIREATREEAATAQPTAEDFDRGRVEDQSADEMRAELREVQARLGRQDTDLRQREAGIRSREQALRDQEQALQEREQTLREAIEKREEGVQKQAEVPPIPPATGEPVATEKKGKG